MIEAPKRNKIKTVTTTKNGIEIKWINHVALPVNNGPTDTNGNVIWFPCEPAFKTNVVNETPKQSKNTLEQQLAAAEVSLEQSNKLPLCAIESDYKLRKVFEGGHLWAIVVHRGIVHPSQQKEINMIDGFTHHPDCPCLKK